MLTCAEVEPGKAITILPPNLPSGNVNSKPGITKDSLFPIAPAISFSYIATYHTSDQRLQYITDISQLAVVYN